MSKELKPYEKETLILKKIRQKKEHQHRRRVEVKAIERGLDRLERTFVVEKQAYLDDLKARNLSIDNVEKQVVELTKELKDIFPKPKAKPIEESPKNGKVACKHCGKLYSKSGIKSHQRACLKKIELAKLQEEIEKLELEETLEELAKEEQAEVIEEIEEIIEDLEDVIDLDELTEDVSFIEIKEPINLEDPKKELEEEESD